MRTGYERFEQSDQGEEERRNSRPECRRFLRKLRGNRRDGIGGIFWRTYRNVRLRMALLVVFALAWWGILYPELCFTEDTIRQVTAADEDTPAVREVDYREIMKAAGDEIVIGSRLWEWLEERNWFRRGG